MSRFDIPYFEIYHRKVQPYARVGSVRARDPLTALWLKVMARHIQQGTIKGKHVLDVGCGSGHKSILLGCLGAQRVTAFDIRDVESARKLADKCGIEAHIFTGDVQCLKELPARNFDIVLASEIIEHLAVDYVRDFAADLIRVTKRGGLIFVTTPNVKGRGQVEASRKRHELDPFGHKKHYTVQEIVALFAEGCHLRRVDFSGAPPYRTKSFGRIFYPIYRFDGSVHFTRRLPSWMKKVYRWSTAPFVIAYNQLLYCRVLRTLEAEYAGDNCREENTRTMYLSFEKVYSAPC